MNKRNHDKFYKKLSDRDGEICKNCKIRAMERQLVIDHINNDNSDNRLENLQFLCRRCNYLKNKRKDQSTVCVSVCEERPLPPEMEKNQRTEPKFRQWLFSKVLASERISYEEALNAGAEHVCASTETVRRYLRKMTSSEGSYVVINDQLGYPYIHLKNFP